MNGVLVVAEYGDNCLADSAARLVSVATALGGPVTLGVAAVDIAEIGSRCAIAGVDEVLAVKVESETFDAERRAAAVKMMIEEARPKIILMAYAIRPASIAAGIAESMNLGFASDVISVAREADGTVVAVRPVYSGKVHAELVLPNDVATLLLLRADAWPAAEAAATATSVRSITLAPPSSQRIRHRDFVSPEGGVDLTQADIIFAVGRGVGEQRNIKAFEDIAKRMDVALGASRPIVSAGWLPAAHQVGQTGVTVRPRLYVAFGISGAQQHLVGMQASGTIVAVNSDRDAAIFDFADFGAIADLNEVAKQMLVRLGA